MNVETLAAAVTIAVAVSGGLSALLSHWLARRTASGRVATSEAAVLWQQSQDMRTMLAAEKAKAEEQRDRLIEAYTTQVFPVLTQINTAVTALTAAVAEDIKLSREALVALRGGEHALPAPGPENNAHVQ